MTIVTTSLEADAVSRKLQAGMIFMQLQNSATGLHMCMVCANCGLGITEIVTPVQ